MNLKEAEWLFQAGALETPVMKKHDLDDGWGVTPAGKHKLNPVLEAARGQVRVLFELRFAEVRFVR